MTTIRRNLMNWQTSLGEERVALQLMSAALLLIGMLLVLAGLSQKEGLMLGLGAIGIVSAFSLRAPRQRSER